MVQRLVGNADILFSDTDDAGKYKYVLDVSPQFFVCHHFINVASAIMTDLCAFNRWTATAGQAASSGS